MIKLRKVTIIYDEGFEDAPLYSLMRKGINPAHLYQLNHPEAPWVCSDEPMTLDEVINAYDADDMYKRETLRLRTPETLDDTPTAERLEREEDDL